MTVCWCCHRDLPPSAGRETRIVEWPGPAVLRTWVCYDCKGTEPAGMTLDVHVLKIAPKWFEAVVRGDKRFEVRKSDRPYNVGDLLQLNEWDDKREEFTGRRTVATIIYIFTSEDFPQGIKKGYCIIGFKHLWYYAQMGTETKE